MQSVRSSVDLRLPPHGRIGILFTDIEDGTRMSKALGDAFRKMRSDHCDRIRAAIEECGGYEVETAGDSFLIVFSHAQAAVACAVAIQRRLADPLISRSDEAGGSWTLKVRIGVHWSEEEIEPHVEASKISYAGHTCVNFAARVQALATGGQILVSDLAYLTTRDGPSFDWQEWRNRRSDWPFKGLPAPERAWELKWDGRSRGEPGHLNRRGFLGMVATLAGGGLLGSGGAHLLHYLKSEPPPVPSALRNPGPLFDLFLAGPMRIVPGAKNQLRLSEGKSMAMSPYVSATCRAIQGICAGRRHVSVPTSFDSPHLAADYNVDAHLMCVGGPVSNKMFADLNGYQYSKVVHNQQEIDLPVFRGKGDMRWGFFCGTGHYGDWQGEKRAAWRYDDGGNLKSHPLYALIDRQSGRPAIEPELSDDPNPLLMVDYLIITRRPHPLYPERRVTSIGGMHGYSLAAFAEDLESTLAKINDEIDRKRLDCFQIVVPARLRHLHDQHCTVATLGNPFDPQPLSVRPEDWA